MPWWLGKRSETGSNDPTLHLERHLRSSCSEPISAHADLAPRLHSIFLHIPLANNTQRMTLERQSRPPTSLYLTTSYILRNIHTSFKAEQAALQANITQPARRGQTEGELTTIQSKSWQRPPPATYHHLCTRNKFTINHPLHCLRDSPFFPITVTRAISTSLNPRPHQIAQSQPGRNIAHRRDIHHSIYSTTKDPFSFCTSRNIGWYAAICG
jgi:hypothetical protein